MNAKKITTGIAIIVGMFTIIGGLYTFDTHYAKAADVNSLSQRIDNHLTNDRINNLQERLWKLEDRYGSLENMPQSVKEQYRESKVSLKLLREKQAAEIVEDNKG